MTERKAAHEYLAARLSFPAWYGRNLDALYDLLTERGPCVLRLEHAEVLEEQGGYGKRLLDTLLDAGRDSGNLTVVRVEAPTAQE